MGDAKAAPVPHQTERKKIMQVRFFAPFFGVVILCSAAAHAALFQGEDRTATVQISAGFDDNKTSALNDFSDGNQNLTTTDDTSSITATATVTAVTSYTPTQYNYNILDESDANLHDGRSSGTDAFFDSDLAFHLDADSAYDASGNIVFTETTTGGGLVPSASVKLRLFQSGSEFRDLFLTTSGPYDFGGVLPAGDYTIRFEVAAQSGSVFGVPASTANVSTSLIGTFSVPEPGSLLMLATTSAATLLRRRRAR
jgi:hypothetical protein